MEQMLDELNNYYKDFRSEDRAFSKMNSSDGDYSKFTYGTTPFETFKNLIDKIKKPPKRFVVLGSSIGWQCFFWNILFPDIPTIGYEIHDVRFRFSCYIADKYELNNITLYNDTLLNAEIQDGDLIWQNNLCLIIDDLCDEVNWRALTKYDDVEIISYKSILKDHISNDRFLLINKRGEFTSFKQNEFKLPVSWTENQTFYIIQSENDTGGESWQPKYDVSFIDKDFIVPEKNLKGYDSMNISVKNVKSEKLKYLYNKNNIKKEFIETGFNVPELYLYTTKEISINDIPNQRYVVKPAHMSFSNHVSINKVDINDINKCLYKSANINEPDMMKESERGIIIEQYIKTIYELKVFVVWGCPLIGDLKKNSNEINRIDFIKKDNKYLNWEKEFRLIEEFAKKIKIDFFRIDFLYDGDKLYASECAFMPSTILPENIKDMIGKNWVRTYYEYYYPLLVQ